MSINHLFLLFSLSISFIIFLIARDWGKIKFHNLKFAENYIINFLIARSFANVGLVLYGFLLLLFLFSPDTFKIFTSNIYDFSFYLGIMALYMVIKGLFGLIGIIKGEERVIKK